MIPSGFIDELLAKTDIVDVVEHYVPLKKSGANYMACCPFHKEKSPSFSVSPSKQFYHCFGCGAHGSAIGFVMEYQGLGFVEAVRFLAERIGLSVPQDASAPDAEARAARKKQQQTLEQHTDTAARFYREQLSKWPQAQTYLAQRGLNAEIIARYGLGYAPDAWQPLAQVFENYPSAQLVESGLVVEHEDSKRHYDRFRNRIMFPIRSSSGQIIGFGGRVLGDAKPKYLNSPDTPLFEKGKHLYGLYEARTAIREAGRILVVEGYMDVVALAQSGIGYAVAALGTATTSDHIKILMRQSDEVYFCFDGDQAGRSAAWRALENALPQLKDGKSLRFLFLPESHDPDSYVREYGSAAFEDALLNQSEALSVYFWQALTAHTDLNTQEGKADLVKRTAPLLEKIQAPALAFLFQQELGRLTGIAAPDLARLIGRAMPPRHVAAKRYTLPERSARPEPLFSLAQKQIRDLLFCPQWAKHVVFPDYLAVTGEAACLTAVAEYCRSRPAAAPAQVWEHFRHSPHAPLLQQALAHPPVDDDDSEAAQNVREQAFCEGNSRLISQIKQAQIEALKQKNSTQGLSAEEKQLMLYLLTAKS
ncbi:DNA primase [Conchiformibius steedae]|uniref:DNA primase n=1 Tax=Conchiformibius steedae TaxID=153493 RepID=A0A3P2A2P1_9NEIS|nr:DNA primase [Conchiformibius steedae]RRD89704.1 DNA primase [Conchiformibius steedae]